MSPNRQPGDDDDARLWKRVGVVAGYATIVATHKLLDGHGFEERQVDIKGLGVMRTYLLTDS